MDLSKYLNEPSDAADGALENFNVEENDGGAKEGQWRDKLYKRKGINFSTSTRENRTLRSIQVGFTT